jgi:hypothetical protein
MLNYIKMILIMIGCSQDLDMRRMEEKTTIELLLWTRSLGVNYSRITPEAGMAMKKASDDDSLSDRVPGRASGPSRTRVDDGGGLQYFSWIDIRAPRVFPMK